MTCLQVCNRHGALLIVDEAHGSHLGLHYSLPRSALQQGADIAVASTHKTLGALTQAAMLHVSHGAPAWLESAVQRQLHLLHTSSPSYILMASLEAAAHAAGQPGALDKPMKAARALRRGLVRAGLPCLDDEALHASFASAPMEALESVTPLRTMSPHSSDSEATEIADSVAAWDTLRVTCLATAIGMSGFELYRRLEERSVVAELATERCVVFALGIGSRMHDTRRALAAVQEIVAAGVGDDVQFVRRDSSSDQAAGASDGGSAGSALSVGRMDGVLTSMPADEDARTDEVQLCDVRAAMYARTEQVQWQQAVGLRSAAMVSMYPPGIPALVPGQVITQADVRQLVRCVELGGRLVGCSSELSDIGVCVDDL